jgi:hypothetical protein
MKKATVAFRSFAKAPKNKIKLRVNYQLDANICFLF